MSKVEEWIYEYILQFLKSRTFTDPIKEFIDRNCDIFQNREENKLEYTVLHNRFKEAIETSLEFMLIEIGCTQEQFVACAEYGLTQEEDRSYFEKIIAVDNFLYFKSLMVQRNAQIQEQAYRLMAASENKNTQNELTNDEAYNTLLKIKENTELECAVAMSLALCEEKEKMGFKVNEDDELMRAIEASKNQMAKNSYNKINNKIEDILDDEEPISIFNRNTLLKENLNYKTSQTKVTHKSNVEIESNNKQEYKKIQQVQEQKFIGLEPQSNVNSLKIEGEPKKQIVNSNDNWKSGLKQGNIDLAIISSSGTGSKKKDEIDILNMVGDLGTVSLKEVNKFDDVKFSTDDEKNKNSLENTLNIKTSQNDLSNLDKLISDSDLQQYGEAYTTDKNGNKINSKGDVWNSELKKFVAPNYSEENAQLYERLEKLTSKLDNKADVSGFMKWQLNNKRNSLDQPLPDLTKIKSKLNTGLKALKNNTEDGFTKENDELKKKFEALQRENGTKIIKDYRDMLLKMKETKNEQELKATDVDSKKLEMRKILADKLKNN